MQVLRRRPVYDTVGCAYNRGKCLITEHNHHTSIWQVLRVFNMFASENIITFHKLLIDFHFSIWRVRVNIVTGESGGGGGRCTDLY